MQTFSKIHHMLGHKVRFGKFKKIKIISTIFSDHNAVWLEITEEGKNKTKQDSKEHKHMAAKQYATKQPLVHWKNKIKKIPRDKWKWKHNDPKPIGCSKSSSKRKIYSNTVLPQETRIISNKQPNLILKAMRESRTNKT